VIAHIKRVSLLKVLSFLHQKYIFENRTINQIADLTLSSRELKYNAIDLFNAYQPHSRLTRNPVGRVTLEFFNIRKRPIYTRQILWQTYKSLQNQKISNAGAIVVSSYFNASMSLIQT